MSGADIDVVAFRSGHAEAFRRINEVWISRWFRLEAKDRLVLQDPQGQVLQKGGAIFMAERGGEPVGCVALLPMADGGLEVAKMGVVDDAKGRGVGRRLMQACVERGRAEGAWRLYLETSSMLAPALGLYRAFGFRDIPEARRPATDYARCDVWMELPLGPPPG